MQRLEIKKNLRIKNLLLKFSWRSKNNFMGRFGGCWNWKIGVQWSKLNYILISLLIFELTIAYDKERKYD